MWMTSAHSVLGIWSIWKTLSSRRSKRRARKLSLQIERFLQQQITAQTNPRSPILADRSHVTYASLISERDVERKQHQEEINLLTEKLGDKETECKSLKTQEINPLAEKLRDKEAECRALKTQNPVSRDLAVAKDCVEKLQETVARQNEVIFHSRETGRTWLCSILRRTKRKLRSRHQSHRTSFDLAHFYEEFNIGFGCYTGPHLHHSRGAKQDISRKPSSGRQPLMTFESVSLECVWG
jgi:hypothetical protein